MSELDYHLRQYDEMYRSTASLIELVHSHSSVDHATVLDVGCGAGANVHWFDEASSGWEFSGIDIDQDLIDIARERNPDSTFEAIPFEALLEHFGEDASITSYPSTFCRSSTSN